jgi:tetratricopeptide (TPR) repeat protein
VRGHRELAKLGPDQSGSLATTYNNLGGAYESKGEYDAAIELYRRCEAIQLAKLGPDHPELATTYNNLGGAYEEQGRV